MLWRNRDFLKLWAGQSISVFGTLLGALPFTAVFVLGASPFQMALLSVAQLLPQFLAGLVAGAWVDRLRRRPIMIVADLGRAALLAAVFVAAVTDLLRMEHLYAVAFALGVLTIFFDVAYLAYLPSVVGREHLLEGNAKLAASTSVMEVGSFGVSGWIVQLASARVAVLVDALSFVVSAASLGAIRAGEPPPVPGEARESIWREVREGVGAVIHDPLLRALGLATVARHFAYGAIGAIILLYATRGLGFGAGLVGIIFGVGGLSSLVGAAFAERATRRLGLGRAMTGAMLVSGTVALCLPLAPGANALGLALLVAPQLFGDACDTVFNINEASLRQAFVPERMLGRVDATIRFASVGVMLVGALAGGAIGETAGLRVALLVGIAGIFVAALVLLVSPVRRVRKLPAPAAVPAVIPV